MSLIRTFFETVNDGLPFVVSRNANQDSVIGAGAHHPENLPANCNWYFTAAEFREGTGRSDANTVARRAIILDIDVDESNNADGKHAGHFYSLSDAAGALSLAIQNGSLPKPSWLVKSGGGIQVYWLSSVRLPPAAWRAATVGMLADASAADTRLTADASTSARLSGLYRIPGSFNNKYNPPRAASILGGFGGYLDNDILRKWLSSSPERARAGLAAKQKGAASGTHSVSGVQAPAFFNSVPAHIVSATTGTAAIPSANTGNAPLNIKLLADQCAVWGHMLRNPDSISYTEWFNVCKLIAHHGGGTLEERRAKVHAISALDKKRYSPAQVDAKFDAVAGDNTSAGFKRDTLLMHTNDMAGSRCVGCAFAASCTSTLQAGRQKIVAKEQVRLGSLTVATTKKAEAPQHLDGSNDYDPFYIDKRGYLVRKNYDRDTFARMPDDTLINKTPYWFESVTHAAADSANAREGSRITAAYFHGGELRRAYVSVENVVKMDGFRTAMQRYGCMIADGVLLAGNQEYRNYAYLQMSKHKANEKFAVKKMGWQNDGSFVVNNIRILPDGALEETELEGEAAVISNKLVGASRAGTPIKGDVNKYIGLIRKQADPVFHPYVRAALLFGLASPLIHLTGVSPFCVLHYGRTGSGKSTVSRMVTAAWGGPEETLVSSDSTIMSLQGARDGMNSLPFILDELRPNGEAANGQTMSEVFLRHSGGSGRSRSGRGGETRLWEAKWNCALISTTNCRLSEFSTGMGDQDEADRMRVIELVWPSKVMAHIDNPAHPVWGSYKNEYADTLAENYGEFGIHFMQWVMRNTDWVKTTARELVNEMVSATSEGERIRAGGFAMAKLAGVILERMGVVAAGNWMDAVLALKKSEGVQKVIPSTAPATKPAISPRAMRAYNLLMEYRDTYQRSFVPRYKGAGSNGLSFAPQSTYGVDVCAPGSSPVNRIILGTVFFAGPFNAWLQRHHRIKLKDLLEALREDSRVSPLKNGTGWLDDTMFAGDTMPRDAFFVSAK